MTPRRPPLATVTMKQAEVLFGQNPVCFITEDFRGECTGFAMNLRVVPFPLRIPRIAWSTKNHELVSYLRPMGLSDADQLFERFRAPFSFVGRDTLGFCRLYTYDPERCVAPVSILGKVVAVNA